MPENGDLVLFFGWSLIWLLLTEESQFQSIHTQIEKLKQRKIETPFG